MRDDAPKDRTEAESTEPIENLMVDAGLELRRNAVRKSVLGMLDAIGLSRSRGRHGRRETPVWPLDGWERLMLVLSRKLGEKILIGENIVLTVVKVDRNQVRLGIEAPSDVAVFREEIAPSRRAEVAGLAESCLG